MATKKSTSRKNDDRVIVINTGGQSSPSPSSGGSRSGIGDVLGPLLGIALLGGAAYLGYTLYQKYQCAQGSANQCGTDGNMQVCAPWPMNELPLFYAWQDISPVQTCTPTPGQGCTSPTGTNGQTECINNQEEVCRDGVWNTTGITCSGTKIRGMACSVPGSGYCDPSSSDYYVCESDGYAYSDGTQCPAQNISPCTRLACSNNVVQCGGNVIPGDNTNDYYTDYVCNPIKGVCNFMLVTHNSPACTASKPAGMGIVVNGIQYQSGHPIAVLTSNLNGCNATCIPILGCIVPGSPSSTPAKITILVVDSMGAGVGGATVTITSDGPGIGGFVNPTDPSDHTINCANDTALTDANGVVDFEWVHTWMANLGHTVNTVNMTVTATHGGGSYSYTFPIQLDDNNGNIWNSSPTCEGITYGSQCRE